MNSEYWKDKKHIASLLSVKNSILIYGYKIMRKRGGSTWRSLFTIIKFGFKYILGFRFDSLLLTLIFSPEPWRIFKSFRKIGIYKVDWSAISQTLSLFRAYIKNSSKEHKVFKLNRMTYISFFLFYYGKIGSLLAKADDYTPNKSSLSVKNSEIIDRYYNSLISALNGSYEKDYLLDEIGIDYSIQLFSLYFKKETDVFMKADAQSYELIINELVIMLENGRVSAHILSRISRDFKQNEYSTNENIDIISNVKNAGMVIWVGYLGRILNPEVKKIINSKQNVKKINELAKILNESIYIIGCYKNFLRDFKQGNFSSWVVSYTKEKNEIDNHMIKDYLDHIQYMEAVGNLVRNINEYELKQVYIFQMRDRIIKLLPLFESDLGLYEETTLMLLIKLLIENAGKGNQINSLSVSVFQQNSSQNVDFLYDITRMFSSTGTFEEICQKVVNSIERGFTFNGAVIFLLHEDKKSIYPFTASQTALIKSTLKMLPVKLKNMKVNFDENDNLVVRSLKEKRPIIHREYWRFAPKIAMPIAPFIQRFAGIQIAVSYPIQFKDEILGALLVSTDHQSFTRYEMYVLDVFSHIAGSAIKTWTLTHELADKIVSLEKSNQFKSELLEIASHELRTPITIIKDSLSMIDDNNESEYLYYAKMASARQLILINNILNSSMIENSSFILYKSEVDINDLIIKIVEELSIFTLHKDLKIRMDLSSQNIVLIDSRKISQVLYNLIYNALKYTSKGFIDISTRRKDGYMVVTVQDTGEGIHAKDLQKIFNKYETGENKEVKRYFGSGIGLHISKYIIEAHKGRITVESKVKKGSSFEFTLPL